MMIIKSTLSDSELSRLIGVHRGAVRDWRIGRQHPADTRAAALAYLDTIARNGTHDHELTIARYQVTVSADADDITTVTVGGHTARGWCGSGVCLLRLVSEAIRIAERDGVVL